MKIKDLLGKMNDRGTNPRVKVNALTDKGYGYMRRYEGPAEDALHGDLKDYKVNSFTVIGPGFLEIYAEEPKNYRLV